MSTNHNLSFFRGMFTELLHLLPHLGYTPLLGFSAVLAFVKVVLYAFLLDVDIFGLLSTMLLISSFFGVSGSFGLYLLAHRELPRFFFRGRYRRGIMLLGRGGMVALFLASILVLLPIIGVKPLGINNSVFIFGIIHGLGQHFFMLTVIESKSRLEMMRYARQILIKTVLLACGGIIAALVFENAYIVIVAELVIILLISAKIVGQFLLKSGLSFSVFMMTSAKGYSIREWRTGAVLLAGSLLVYLSINADRWIAANLLSAGKFGIYSFAWIPLMVGQAIQASLNAGFFPILVRRHVATPGIATFKLTTIVSIGLLIIGILGAIVANTFSSWGIDLWYPEYAAALPLIPFFLTASVFRLADFWSSYLIVVHQESTLLKIQVLIFIVLLTAWLVYGVDRIEENSLYNIALFAVGISIFSYVANAVAAFLHRTTSVV